MKTLESVDHYQPVLDNSSSDRSSDRVPGVEDPENSSGNGNLEK